MNLNPVLSGNVKDCCGCGACISACPAQCIMMKNGTDGFKYPYINESKCIHCNQCRLACPVLSEKTESAIPIATWAAIANDKDIQISSSSGGVFALLAENVVKSGGCVYGAAFSNDFYSVHHIKVEDTSDLSALKTSKYLQSDTYGVYKDIKKKLMTGRKVLFSGTPCQTAGLRAFLGASEYDNLISVAVICHGVPSPKLWRKYLDYIVSSGDYRIKDINFRHKKNGWNNFGLYIKKENRKDYYKELSFDPYLQMFLQNICLRESCYQCFAKEKGSGADITIGDFWGISEVAPEMDDGLGTSLVLVHTKKGQEFYESIADCLIQKKVEYKDAIRNNTAYNTSVQRPTARDVFFEELNNMPWKCFEKKYANISFRKKLKRILNHFHMNRMPGLVKKVGRK